MERAAGGGSAAVVIKPPKKTEREESKREAEEEGPIIRFVVRPRNNVKFAVGTVDNEGMGKRKSKGKNQKMRSSVVILINMSLFFRFQLSCFY